MDLRGRKMSDGRTIGYARGSTDDQDLSLQLDALEQQGIPKSLICTCKLSGAKADRPGLEKCLDMLQLGTRWPSGASIVLVARCVTWSL